MNDLSVDEFVDLMMPEMERNVDDWIESQPLEDRAMLSQSRDAILRQYVQAVRLENYRHRLAQAEACIRPQDETVH